MEYKKEIIALYDKKYIRIYQAHREKIARQAVELKTFGSEFNVNRMTWIKPSFLWLMHRSNWAAKKNQEYILSIDILRDTFDSFLEQAVLTTDESSIFKNYNSWEKAFNSTDVYCQWDPDRSLKGNPLNRGAIQLGIKNNAIDLFLASIYNITDMTKDVNKWREKLNYNKLTVKDLPKEKVYPVSDYIKKRLNMSF